MQREPMAIKTLHLTNAFHTHSGGAQGPVL